MSSVRLSTLAVAACLCIAVGGAESNEWGAARKNAVLAPRVAPVDSSARPDVTQSPDQAAAARAQFVVLASNTTPAPLALPNAAVRFSREQSPVEKSDWFPVLVGAFLIIAIGYRRAGSSLT